MRNTDLEDIRAVIRRVRREHFPDLDEAFLDHVLEIEAASLEDDAGAQRLLREAVAAQEAKD